MDAFCPEDVSGAALGNPYVGIVVDALPSRVEVHLGGRLPALRRGDLDESGFDAEAPRIGLDTEWVDRMEAFLPKVISVESRVMVTAWSSPYLKLRLYGGPVLLHHPDARGFIHNEKENEVHLRFGMQGVVDHESWDGGVRLTGRHWTTAEDVFRETTFWQTEFYGAFASGDVRPVVAIRVPFGSSGVPVEAVLSLAVEARL